MRKRPSSPSARLGGSSALSIVALERRIAFDGAAAATAAKAIHAVTKDLAPHAIDVAREAPAQRESEQGFTRPATADTARALQGLDLGGGDLRVPARTTALKSVVFIESDVPDVATLIKDVDHSAQIVLLDSSKDGVDAIASYLAAHEGVHDVYIFSHGSRAQLDLGTATLDETSMQGRYADDLATIKGALAPGANILVYGCDFAEGAVGDAAARLLGQLTGAAVAASTDLTGGTAEGGDFVLEDHVGGIDAPGVLSASIATDYVGLLAAAPTTIFANSGTGAYKGNLEFLTFANTSIGTGGITNGATATYSTASGSTVTATFSHVSNASDAATFKPAALTAYAPSKFYGGYNNTASSSIMLYGGYKDTASFTVTFTATDKNGNSYTPNIAFADGEVTDASSESHTVTTNGGAFQNVETIGSNSYSLTGTGTQSVTLRNTGNGVPLLLTDHATSLNITVQIAGGKQGFVLALVDPTLSLDANASSGAAANNYQTTFTEKNAAVSIADIDVSAVEPGSSTASSAKIVLTDAQAGDVLGFSGSLPAGITSSTDTSVPGQITVTLSGTASLASYQTAIRDVTFANTSSNPSTLDRTIDVTYNDGGQDSNTAISTIHVTAVNDAPVETVPGAQATNKDTALSISGLSVSDVDANGSSETVTLSVSNGTLSLAKTSGLTFSTGTGTNDTSETFTGTLADINNAIATVKYQPTTGYIGSDTLSFSTNDKGNTGTGGAMTASASVGITVDNVNPTANGTLTNHKYNDGAANVSIATSQAFSDSLGLALTYTATGLPAGLTLDKTTGQITGTIDHDASIKAPSTTGSGATLDGTYTVIETASDGQGGSTTQTFTIDSSNQAPVVGTATAAQSNKDGDTIAAVNAAAAFSDLNNDPLTYAASGLPSGLSISQAGLITGTIAGNAAPGPYTVSVTATDDKGAATTETFTWTVKDVPPTTNGTLANQSVTDGQAGVAITTAQAFTPSNGNAVTYSATGLAKGLSIDATTGKITGTVDHDASAKALSHTGSGATLDGKYTVAVTAADGLGGSATQSFTIDSTNQAPVVETATANQSSKDGDTVAAVDAAATFSDPNGDPLTYKASGLPSGLSISPAGLITGTIAGNAAPGPYNVSVTATDDKGAATTETFTWTVKDVPPTTNGTLANQSVTDGQAGVAIATAQGFTDANGNALTYTATGLPAGLTIDAASGKITGKVDHDASKNGPFHTGSGATLDGKYTVAVTAADGLGGAATQGFTIDSTNSAPVVGTVTMDQANKTGDTIAPVDASKAFSDPNSDPLTYSATNLPTGLAIDPATGIISGRVAVNAKPGSYAVGVTAMDDKGASTGEALTWTITDTSPTTSGSLASKTYADATANIAIATAGGFASPNGLALTYAASGLPAGLSIDLSSGIITGQLGHDASKIAPATSGAGATLDGTYTVTVTASDGQGGTAQQVFKLDATNNAPALVAQTPDQTGADGQTVSLDGAKPFRDPNTGDTFTYAATGLPTGLTIDPHSGLVSGTIDPHASRNGPFTVTVTITDDKGAATSESFHWGVADVAPVATPALPDRSVADGGAVSLATAGGFTNPNKVAYAYTATGLPKGLAIDPGTGVISGRIDHDASIGGNGGTYTIAVTADDGQGGTATNSFHLTSSNHAPVVGTKTTDQTTAEGAAVAGVDASKAFADPNIGDSVAYSASNLPPGLAIDPNTGVISGTVPGNATPGAYFVTVTATDDKGAATPETFDWSIDNVPPVAKGTLPNQTYHDSTTGIAIDTAGGFTDAVSNRLLYAATGLPAGLSIDQKTGQITGAIDHDASANGQTESGSGATLDGTYQVVVTAKDSLGGSAMQAFTIDAKNDALVTGTTTAVQTNTEGDAISVDTGIVFSDPNLGDVLTFSATNLPPGLSIDPKSGLISGKIASGDYPNSPYQVRVTATDEKGASARETFSFVTLPPPVKAVSVVPNYSGFDGTITSIDTASHFAGSSDATTVYSVSGLPTGLSIDAATGRISGTIDHDASRHGQTESGAGATLDGKYDVTVTATNAGGAASQTLVLDVANQAPVVGTKTADQTAATGQTIATLDASQAFADPNGDPLTYAAAGLPTGLSIDMATGKITGTISATAPGRYSVSVTAKDDKGAASVETFAWTVNDIPPTASGTVAAESFADSTANIQIATASGFTSPNELPLTYRATGLPSGLSIDPASGTITGQLDHDASSSAPVTSGAGATLDGTYTVTVSADDGQGGTAVQSFTIDATNTAPAIIRRTGDQHGQDGQAVSLNIAQAFADANVGDQLTYSASSLPQGLAIDPATGLVSGTIANTASRAGPYSVSVTATDDKGAATSETFTWAVVDLAPQATPPLADRSVNDGSAVTYVTSGGFTNPNKVALAYSASGLPSGLSIDPATGLISGTLDHDASALAQGGVYTVAVTVDDGQGGTATNTFHLTASNQAPAVVMPLADISNQDGDTVAALAAAKAFADPNAGDTLSYAASNLPKGLAIDPTTGVISGTIAGDVAAGGHVVTVTAFDDKGAATPATFTWFIGDVPPTASGTLPGQHLTDGRSGIDIATAGGFASPNGLPLTYAATGLPAGLAIDPASGRITGTLDHDASKNAPTTSGSGATLDGTYTVIVTASDGQGGVAAQSFTLDAANAAPTIVAQTADQHGTDGQQVSLDASKAFADPNVGDTLTYAASGLPAGLAIDPASGLVTGTIDPHASAAGPYTATVTATDDKGAATMETFRFTVADVPPKAGAPVAAASAADGTAIAPIDAGSHFASPNGLPLTYAATGLPAGLAIDPASGRITGTLDHDASKNAPTTSGSGATLDGTYTVIVTASDGQGGVAAQSFTLDAANAAPTIVAQTTDQHGTDGQQVSLDASKAFADPNVGDTLTYAASGLPAGLAIDPASGLVTGTIDPHASAAGPYTATVTATDDKGAATMETFRFTVADVPPKAGAPVAAASAADGTAIAPIDAGSHFASPNGLPLTYAATGLPAGLAIDPASGRITGTLDHDASKNAPTTSGSGATLDGTYTVIVTASDGQGGVAAQSFTLDATNAAPTIVAQMTDQHAADGQQVSLDASKAFADPNTGDTLTYAASGLPAGLAIDPASGLVTGAIDPRASAAGPYIVTVTATDDKGAATPETFRFTVADVPPKAGAPVVAASAADGTAIAPIDAGSHFASPNGLPLTYAATGLLAGLAIDPVTGRITGTLDHDASKNAPATSGSGATLDGTYTVIVTASDGQGGVATQSFTLDATNAAPTIVAQTADQHGTDGQQVSLDASKAFADPNVGDTLTYAASGLPAGLAIDPASGLVTGTIDPRASTAGPYAVAVTATDDKGAATSETFRFTVADVPPTATALAGQVADDGAALRIATAGAFTSPNGIALRYAATGLPVGLAIDPATGVISGALDHDASIGNGSGAGIYTIAVNASDGQGGSATTVFHLTAANQAPSVGTRTVDQSNVDGATIAPVDASRAFADPNGDPLTYAAANLPAGLAIDPATGRISGTVAGNAQPATYQVVVTAADDKGAATSETFALTIADAPPTAQGTLATHDLADGQRDVAIATAGGFADANGNALTYAATGLPAGLAIDPRTGAITGVLDRGASAGGDHGTYEVTVTASDGLGGTATQILTIVTANQPPVVGTATADQHGQDGQAVSVETAPAFADPNGDPLTYGAAGLPPGLAIDPGTGRITGTLAGTASASGRYAVTITATDDKGATTSETFAWTVADVPPTATTPIDIGPVPDGTTIAPFDAYAPFANPNGLPLTYAASGLPAGLAIDPATGIVTGTLDHEASSGGVHGIYTVTVTASDGQGGTASQVFTLEATNQAPALVAPTPDQAGAQGQQVASVDTSQAYADPNAGDIVIYAAKGLPNGLAIDPATGLIAGTIAPDAAPGDYAVTVSATDDKGAATAETFHWSVGEVPPVAGTLPAQHFGDGQGGIAIDTAGGFASPNGLPLTYDASGLPAGLAIDPATGRITGTLDRNASASAPVKLGSGATLEGIYAVTITATDPFGGTTSQVFAIEVGNVPPAIAAQTPDQHGRAGQAIAPLDLGAAFADAAGDRLTFAATGLPLGLAFDPATGRVTGIIDRSLASGQVDTVTVTATDEKDASVTESFLYRVDAVAPSILPPPSFLEPAAALLPDILGAAPVGIADLGHHRSVEPATPVLDVINQTSGDEERSQVIAVDGIVVSTVNGIAPLNGLQRLSEPGTGIVRSGAATDERGDRFDRTQNAVGRGVEALSTPSNFLGATSIDVEAAARSDAPSINIETMLRDRVLSISIGSGARTGDPLARVAVTLADGRPLPAWLRLEGKGYVVGKVPGGVESIDIKITSTFASGVTSQRSVTIRTDRGTITPLAPRPQAGRTLSHMVAATRSAPADLARIARLLD